MLITQFAKNFVFREDSFICKTSYGQDTIYTKDGRELPVKILENDGSIIKYKDYNNPDAIIKNFDVTYIDFIRYENGNIERFTITDKQNVITQIDNSDHTIDFLKRKYEKNLATMKFANAASWVGLAGLGLSFLVIINHDSNTDPNKVTAFITGSGILLNGGVIIYYIARYRARHYDSRIQELSLIATPNQFMCAKNKLNMPNINLGIRITF